VARTSRSVFTFTKFEKRLIDKIDNKTVCQYERYEVKTMVIYTTTTKKNVKIRRKKKL